MALQRFSRPPSACQSPLESQAVFRVGDWVKVTKHIRLSDAGPEKPCELEPGLKGSVVSVSPAGSVDIVWFGDVGLQTLRREELLAAVVHQDVWEQLQHLLGDAFCREMRRLGDSVRKESRAELRCVAEEHAEQLRLSVEALGGAPAPRKPSVASQNTRQAAGRTGSIVMPELVPDEQPSRPATPIGAPPALATGAAFEVRAPVENTSVDTLPLVPAKAVRMAAPTSQWSVSPAHRRVRPHLPGCFIEDDGAKCGDAWANSDPKLNGGEKECPPMSVVPDVPYERQLEDHLRRSSSWSATKDPAAGRNKASMRSVAFVSEHSSDSDDAAPDRDSRFHRQAARIKKTVQIRQSMEIMNMIDEFHVRQLEERTTWNFASMVKHHYFDYFVGVVLLANALTIGLQVDYLARNTTTQVPVTFRVLDYLYCVFFAVELILRASVYGPEFFRGRDWKWNYFDTTVVVIQVLDEVFQQLLKEQAIFDIIDNLGMVRLLRLGRLVRFLRMVRLIPELKSMVYLVMASMGSFFWTGIMLMTLMYCVAVYFTELVSVLTQRYSDDDLADVRSSWGSIPLSMLSLFMAISGGDDWGNLIKFYIDQHNVLNTVIFAFYIAFATLVMLNLVTGVFVEGAHRIIREDRDKELLKVAAKLFLNADQDGSNELSATEFLEMVEDGHLDDYCAVNGINVKEVDILYQLLDDDGSGSVSVVEFVKGCQRLQGQARAADVAAIRLTQKRNMLEIRRFLNRLDDQIRGTKDLLATLQRSNWNSGGAAAHVLNALPNAYFASAELEEDFV